uniref:Sorting nexin-14 n=1 Tax=Steinernema glaseri TaxID=37863 RepID=A0A1I7YEA5_9BILA
MLPSAVVCLFLAAFVWAAPLAKHSGTLCAPRPKGIFPYDFENPERMQAIGETLTILNMLVNHRFSEFFSTLTDEEKQSAKWVLLGASKPEQRDALGTEAKNYLNQIDEYLPSVDSPHFREDMFNRIARFNALSAEAKADLSEKFDKHTKMIKVCAFYLKLDSFLDQLDLKRFLSEKVQYTMDVPKLFGKQDKRSLFIIPHIQRLQAFLDGMIYTRKLVIHPILLDLVKNLTDADKKAIDDYMVVVDPPRRETTANLDDLSTAVKNLYQDIHNYIDIPSFLDPTTEKFAEQAHKIIMKHDALSAEDKAQFQKAFPARAGHIEGLRLYFKLDSFLDSSASHKREMEAAKSLRLSLYSSIC